ncbi:MAG: hypothetical protein D6710_02160 [Nitrospirae bacterium]|nr:MAG: hypothetical protein D6710_02160 [Nitrospirota bacterium]
MYRIAVLIVFLVLFSFNCSTKYTPKLVQHIRGSSFSATEHGYYTAELVMKPKHPHVGVNRAHLIIHNYDAVDMPGLRVYVEPYLPSKNLTSPEKPRVKDAGRGLYIIDNIVFPEPGDWVLKISIYGEEFSDRVTLKIPPVRMMPMMK